MKLTIIGGGGFRVPLIYRALLADHGVPRIDDVFLYDTDAERLATIARVLGAQAAPIPDAPRVSASTDLREALQGADFVFSALRVGGITGRTVDEEVALRLGVLGQETTGAGGIAFALRTVPVALDLARAIAETCPDAWVVNFTNPAGIITEAMQSVLGTKVVGICDSADGLVTRATRALGLTRSDVRADYVGLNHLGWLRALYGPGGSASRGGPDAGNLSRTESGGVESGDGSGGKPGGGNLSGVASGSGKPGGDSSASGVASGAGSRSGVESNAESGSGSRSGVESNAESSGTDLLPALLADPERLALVEEARLMGPNWVRALGAIPNEYMYFYYCTREAIQAITDAPQTRGEFLIRQQGAFYREAAEHPDAVLDLWQRARRQRDETYLAELRAHAHTGERNQEDIEEGGYEKVALRLLGSLLRGEQQRLLLNVRNGGTVPALPEEGVIEVPCLVDAGGPRPVAPAAPVVGHELGLMLQVKEVEQVTIEAARSGSRALALKALALHPLVDSVAVAGQLLREYLRRSPEIAAALPHE